MTIVWLGVWIIRNPGINVSIGISPIFWTKSHLKAGRCEESNDQLHLVSNRLAILACR